MKMPKKGEAPTSYTRVQAKLLYDSADDPRPSGVRSGETSSRHILYQGEEYCLDMQLEKSSEVNGRVSGMVIVGQIADLQKPLEPLSDVPFLLVAEDDVLAEGMSNGFGEFHLEFDADDSVSLLANVQESLMIEVPLGRHLKSWTAGSA